MAPERINGEVSSVNDCMSAKADVWSVGVILFFLVFGKPPFDGKTTTSLVKQIKTGLLDMENTNWKEDLRIFMQLIMEMLQPEPIERISVVTALNH